MIGHQRLLAVPVLFLIGGGTEQHAFHDPFTLRRKQT